MTDTSKKGTVFFDVGGPLIDEYHFDRVFDRLILKKLKEYDMSISYKELSLIKQRAVKEWAHRYHHRVIELIAGKNKKLLATILDYFPEAMQIARKAFRVRSGARNLLKFLNNKWHIGTASKLPPQILISELERFDLLKFIDVSASLSLPYRKPKPEFFKKLLSISKGDKIWMIGNRLDVDIIPAKRFGINTIFFRVGTHRNQQIRNDGDTPDYVISKIDQVCKLII